MTKLCSTAIWVWAVLLIYRSASTAHGNTAATNSDYSPPGPSGSAPMPPHKAAPSHLVKASHKITQDNAASAALAEHNPQTQSRSPRSAWPTRTSDLPCNVTTSDAGDVIVNCAGRGLTEVPRDLPRNVTSLDLSYNVISQLNVTSFAGLDSVVSLNLEGNRLSYLALPCEVFHSVTSLRVLLLGRNTATDASAQRGGCEAPWPLFSLTDLSLDLLPDVDFDERFSQLRSLTSLTLYMASNMKLTNTTFQGFASNHVKKLRLQNVNSNILFGVDAGSFSYFPLLTELNMHGAHGTNIKDIYTILRDLQGRNMSLLNFDSFSAYFPRKFHDRPVETIDATMNQVLAEICVKELVFSFNNIYYFDLTSLLQGRFKDCIEHLDLSHNPLKGPLSFPVLLHRFSALKFVDISLKRKVCLNDIQVGSEEQRFKYLVVPLPSNLEYLDFSGIGKIGYLPQVRFLGGKHLIYLNMSCSAIVGIPSIEGIENLQTLDLSYNQLNTTAPDFFDHFPELRTLGLRSARLNQTWLLSWGERYFRSLSKVTDLDVRDNDLQLLPRTSFPSLSTLLASGNVFTQVPVSLESRPGLRLLDLAHNAITVLPPRIRQQLDALASQQSLKVVLRGNPLSCDCSSLDFVEWLWSTKVQLDEGRNYVCVGPDGMSTTTAQMVADWERVWYKCHGPDFLLGSASLTAAWLTTLVVAFFVVKFKTNLQHMLLRMLGLGRPRARRLHFQHDVYVAFNLEDDDDRAFVFRDLRQRLEGEAGLRLFLRGRNDLPGSHVAESILEGLDSSWRVMFVLTPAFLRDPWCDFMVSTAVRSTPHVIPDRLLLLLLQPLDRADLPRRLLDAVDEDVIYDVSNADSRAAVLERVCHRLCSEA